MLNSALAVTETESVLAAKGVIGAATGGCEATGCPIPRNHSHPYQPVIPVVSLQPICHSLTAQLSQLLVRTSFPSQTNTKRVQTYTNVNI